MITEKEELPEYEDIILEGKIEATFQEQSKENSKSEPQLNCVEGLQWEEFALGKKSEDKDQNGDDSTPQRTLLSTTEIKTISYTFDDFFNAYVNL